MSERGFTLVEMMFTLTVILILSTVAAVSYTKNLRKVRSTEVTVVAGELELREGLYHQETGRYLPLSRWPVLPGNGERAVTFPLPEEWAQLRPSLPAGGLYCQYGVEVSASGFRVLSRCPWQDW